MVLLVMPVRGGKLTLLQDNGCYRLEYAGELPRDLAVELVRRDEQAQDGGLPGMLVNGQPASDFLDSL